MKLGSWIARLALGISLPLWAAEPLPSSFSNRSIHDGCMDLFGYLEFTESRPEGLYINTYLKLPTFADPEAQPSHEIKRAVSYVAHYTPDPLHIARGVSLAQHRAYTLKAFFVAISHAYPYWTAQFYRDHEGSYIFYGNFGRYVKIDASDGLVTWGDEVLSLPD
ncbi:MAG TPA: hypothetical protein VM901_06850 [Bdellovibrionota bacterium]|jgi:hypothetical protein|nr:hypothetical protein [Bdellovibrionota bacterium]